MVAYYTCMTSTLKHQLIYIGRVQCGLLIIFTPRVQCGLLIIFTPRYRYSTHICSSYKYSTYNYSVLKLFNHSSAPNTVYEIYVVICERLKVPELSLPLPVLLLPVLLQQLLLLLIPKLFKNRSSIGLTFI
jgi:hypothetical protein